MSTTFVEATAQPLADYYRFHAALYDATRWAFLFGRQRLIAKAAAFGSPQRILEIGCGTGKNLVALARAFPQAQIVGVDLSAHMLEVARRKLSAFGARVSLEHRAYEGPVTGGQPYDLIVFSYALSMMNPGYDNVLAACREDLNPEGTVAVVDFHHSRWSAFRRWMGVNHVRMEGQVLARLRESFTPVRYEVHRAYAGLWRYMLFVGKHRQRSGGAEGEGPAA